MMSVEAVLWDFGGVITTSPFEAFARYEREHDLPPDFIRTLNATNAHDNAWAKLERSEVDLDGFCELYEAEAREAGHEIDAREVLACLSGDLRPEMVQALRRIHDEGLRQAMLTNNFVGLGDGTGENGEDPRRGLRDLFEVVVESSTAGVRKPEPEFYEIACRELGIEPTGAVFLDDLGVNLKPARAMGMTTIKVVDPSAALVQLEDALGFPVTP